MVEVMATILPRILTLSEVAACLRLSEESVMAQVRAGRLPVHQQGGVLQFLQTDVETWSDRYDMRKILMRQVGIFADDESLPQLLENIDKRRKEDILDAID